MIATPAQSALFLPPGRRQVVSLHRNMSFR
jgi:hypothetical protein